MNIVLYSTGCPRCKVLKQKLSIKGVKYSEVNDRSVMLNMGLDEVPVLEVDGNKMGFLEANSWINEQ